MENKDFRVGDKVTRIHVEYGYVLREGHRKEFPELKCGPYSQVGFYHGHNVAFTAEGEEVPKRTVTRYINLYRSQRDHNILVTTSPEWLTEEEAREIAFDNAIAIAVPVEIPEEEEA